MGAASAVFHLSAARFRPLILLIVSYAFYATYSVWGAVLLLGVTLVVHQSALAIGRRLTGEGGSRLIGVTVAALIILLAGFKLASALSPGPESIPDGASDSVALRVLVPLGLSYYIFKLVGYLLDVYWEKVPSERNFVAVAVYAAFFPQIVSGPIERAGSFFEQ